MVSAEEGKAANSGSCLNMDSVADLSPKKSFSEVEMRQLWLVLVLRQGKLQLDIWMRSEHCHQLNYILQSCQETGWRDKGHK